MEGDLQGSSGFDQFAGAFDIHGTIRAQNSRHNSLNVFAPQRRDLRFHRGKLNRGVNEIAGTRADENVKRQYDRGAGLADEIETWCEATEFELLAEFDAASASAFGGASALQIRHGNFEKRRGQHGEKRGYGRCGRTT